VSCARILEALPSRQRHWEECCHHVEAPCSPARAITGDDQHRPGLAHAGIVEVDRVRARQAWTTPALPPIAEVRRGQVPTDPGSMSRATASTPPMRATTPASWAGRQASGRYEECWHAARGLALLGGGCRLGVVGVARVRVVDHEDRGVEDRRGQHHHGQQPE
jgi:hypothetical protein